MSHFCYTFCTVMVNKDEYIKLIKAVSYITLHQRQYDGHLHCTLSHTDRWSVWSSVVNLRAFHAPLSTNKAAADDVRQRRPQPACIRWIGLSKRSVGYQWPIPPPAHSCDPVYNNRWHLFRFWANLALLMHPERAEWCWSKSLVLKQGLENCCEEPYTVR